MRRKGTRAANKKPLKVAMNKVVLQARPTRPPSWWPRSPRTRMPLWASCDRDGGYTMGLDRLMSFPRGKIDQIKADWLVDHEGRSWQFRVRAVPRTKR